MTAFRDDPEEWQRLDWRLLQNSPITLYWRVEVLAQDSTWLLEHGYRIYQLDCAMWMSEADFHRAVKHELKFPDYYGANLDAFNDCITDLAVPDGGAALQLIHFDAFARREPRTAQVILDIIASGARHFLLTGRRFLALVQSDDGTIEFAPVGSTPVMWNPSEWLKSTRT